MPSIDPGAKGWQLAWAARVGKAVQDRRKELGLTAQQLAGHTEQLGYPISRVAISKIESNSRAGKLDVAEVAVLAMALGIPPVMLLYPGLPNTSYRYLPNFEHYAIDGLMWFSGENLSSLEFGGAASWEQILEGARPLVLSRQFYQANSARRIALLSANKARVAGDEDEAVAQMRHADAQHKICSQILSLMRSAGLPIAKQYSDLFEGRDA